MTQARHELVRAIGRWSLVALVVNSVIGSGVFGLPSVLAGLMGAASPWAVLVGGALVGVIMACFAEVASQFTQAGGPYLYARTAFGRFMGIQMGWMLWLAQLAAPAANANLFVTYLGEFWPHATDRWVRFVILTVLIGILALVNYRGVRAGTELSNVFTVAKLLPLGIVIGAGGFYLLKSQGTSHYLPAPAVGMWLKAMLLLVFAYGGFETALTPMSEAQDPRRDTVCALFMALGICTLLYTLIQWIVILMLPDPIHSERPLADVARLTIGQNGAGLVAIGALISFYGYLSAKVLAVPRVTFALAEAGELPSWFAAVHRRFLTPYVSILVFAACVWLLALAGSFAWNLTLSAVARLFYYGVGCAALPILRRKQPGAALFRLPGGDILAMVGVLICLVLVTQVDRSQSPILVITVLLAFVNWAIVRRRSSGKNRDSLNLST